MWYMHDGAPAHFSRVVRGVLNNVYHVQWVGRGGPTTWPPRSPDLSPLVLYLWGHVKTLVYVAPVDNEEALHRHTVDACQTISSYPAIFERMRRSMIRGVEACIELHGGILSTYYKCTLIAITRKLNASGHMLIWTVFLFLYEELEPKFCPRLSISSCTSIFMYTIWSKVSGHLLENVIRLSLWHTSQSWILIPGGLTLCLYDSSNSARETFY
jgi:hypothetical protein